ncbi:class I SAM-dependent DNA methyltransferase [Massilia sp. W12]|uniref:class I SAM-dependent DNA methyltransferase n=1 Tax=Massilia sp. W12 TaxID=3126507 RepID=UPI0030D32E7A
MLNRAVWQACDSFRASVDSYEYKNFVLGMLFLKFIADVMRDHDEGRSPDVPELFNLPLEANFYWLLDKSPESGNQLRLDRALRLLELANRDKLNRVFDEIQFDSAHLGAAARRDELARQLLQKFSRPELDLRPSRIGSLDVIGNAYEYLIARFASDSGKKAGEFYTPAQVSELMAMLVDAQDGERIYDPACGSGSLLLHCLRHARSRNARSKISLWGQESKFTTWQLAKMNMFLHGESGERIMWADSLLEPKFVDLQQQLYQFEVVVANPPFSLQEWGHASLQQDRWKRFARGMPPASNGDYAFLLHMLASLDPQRGRMAVIVPGGVLFRRGAEGELRRKLLQENLIESVIALPPNLFYGTELSASILFMRSGKRTRDILFIDASRECDASQRKNRLRESDLQGIMQQVRSRSSTPGYASLVSLEQVLAQDGDLRVAAWVEAPPGGSENPDLQALLAQQEAVRRQIAASDAELRAALRALGVLPPLHAEDGDAS